MRRLLWKEWIESRWLLLALLTAPVVQLLVFKDPSGLATVGLTHEQSAQFLGNQEPGWIAVIVAAIWGASTLGPESHRNRFSSQLLPVGRGKTLVVKVFSGLLSIIVCAVWTAVLVRELAPVILQRRVVDEFVPPNVLNFAGALLVIFCLALNASLISSTATGVLIGLGAGIFVTLVAREVHPRWEYQWIAPGGASYRASSPIAFEVLFAAIVSLGAYLVWRGGMTASFQRRAMRGIGTPVLLMIGVQIAWQPLSLRALGFPVHDPHFRPVPEVTWLPSHDHKHVALIEPLEYLRRKQANQLRLVLVSDEKPRELLSAYYIELFAWSPSSDAIFVGTASRSESRIQIVRVDLKGKTTVVCSLPDLLPNRLHYGSNERARVTPGGGYLVIGRRLSWNAYDLWSVDLRTNQARVIAPGLSYDSRPMWEALHHASVIVKARMTHRLIALDGSGIKTVSAP